MRAEGGNITKHRISIRDIQSMNETIWADSTSLYCAPFPSALRCIEQPSDSYQFFMKGIPQQISALGGHRIPPPGGYT